MKFIHKLSKTALIILLFLIIINNVYSIEYYADQKINIDSSGIAYFEGISNNNAFNKTSSNMLTSKNKDIWTFNLKINETFSNYIIKINFPKNTQITYLKSTGKPYITYDNKLEITEIGKNQKIELIIQYKINTSSNEYTSRDFILGGIILIFVSIGFLIIIKFSKGLKKKNINALKSIESENKTQNLEDLKKYSLSERQQNIIDIIKKNNGEVSQNYLEKSLNIPKSSLSRNINSLKFKGIIEKINKGNINLIMLKKR